MVDVEIIDAKNDNQSIFVSAGPEACICSNSKVRHVMPCGVELRHPVAVRQQDGTYNDMGHFQ